MVKSRLRQVRYRAGRRVVGARGQREQVGAPEDGNVVPAADDYVAFEIQLLLRLFMFSRQISRLLKNRLKCFQPVDCESIMGAI